jgi:hypothetical protein
MLLKVFKTLWLASDLRSGLAFGPFLLPNSILAGVAGNYARKMLFRVLGLGAAGG